ncbi:ABC transporter ATP-binding protein [Schaalia vaccimaxillae]|uniref:ABC transporter ATP-binding protein n=1 Tax=Schaalia vaccimaxillae TaxID=183916 RepID=UPI0003B67C75|nr:ATP-binding cassette domain-containing protein [Schaalia vaccimaxillae]
MDELLSLKNATCQRQGRRILDSVTWQTRQGEHWAVLGPNGAGKTTLVRAAAGRSGLDAGEASFVSQRLDVIDAAELATRIGFASASLTTKIRSGHTVRDVVRSAAWGLHVAPGQSYDEVDDQRSDDLLAAFGVGHLADRKFSTLSEGESQRVLLARALMTDPEVLILDEPTAGLDLSARETLVGALAEIMGGPRAPQVILVTHQVEEIPQGITHALLMKQGQIVHAGPIDEVMTSDRLSEVFDLDLRVGADDGRWWARATTVTQSHESPEETQ